MLSGCVIKRDKKPRKKCRKWQLEVHVGKDLATGKPDRRFKYLNDCSWSEANEELDRFIDDIKAGRDKPKRTSRLFEDYAKEWMASRKDEYQPGTIAKNENCTNCANMHIGKADLAGITPKALEDMYKALMKGKSPSGKPLSGTYVCSVATTLHTIFRDAIRDGLLKINPCETARRPKTDTEERKTMNIDQIKSLTAALNPEHSSELALLLCIKAGLRRGEAYGLFWEDIDFDEEVIHVRHTLDKAMNLKEPKTKKSKRDLPLTPSIRADLEKRKAYLEKVYAKKNKKFGLDLKVASDTPVICNDYGEREIPTAATRWWVRNRKRFGCEGMSIHDLRHSYLSEMARRKVPVKVLQELAGHEKYSTTMNIYVHTDMEQKREAAALADW